MRAPTILQGTVHYFPGGWVLVLKMLSISRSCQTSSTTQVDVFFPTCVAVVISIFVRSFLKMGDPKSCLDPPSHHRFQYQVMVVHNLDDLGYPHDLLWMVAKSESPVENGGLYHYRVSTIPNWWFLGFRWPIHRRKLP